MTDGMPAGPVTETRDEVTEIIAKARQRNATQILNRMRRGDLQKAGALPALQALGYDKDHAAALADAARPGMSIKIGPARTQPASLADIINGIDWHRINAGLTYALLHGGNLPPGFMNDLRRGRS